MGQAVGDALGVPYECGVRALTGTPQLLGGIAPGRWSDDTEMAVSIAEVAAAGADLRTDDAQQRIAQDLLRWYQDGPPGIAADPGGARPGAAAQRSGSDADALGQPDLHARPGRPATARSCAPVQWCSPTSMTVDAMVEAAQLTSALTHARLRHGTARPPHGHRPRRHRQQPSWHRLQRHAAGAAERHRRSVRLLGC